jgi:hypothetical protein
VLSGVVSNPLKQRVAMHFPTTPQTVAATHQSASQSIDQSINQSSKQSIKQPINQPIIQSPNQFKHNIQAYLLQNPLVQPGRAAALQW